MLWNCGVGEDSYSPLDCKEIQPVHPKGHQSWIFIGKTDTEAETPILWPHDAKNWLTGRDSDTGKDWWWKEKGTTEDEMIGWHHRLDGHEFEQAPRVSDGQGNWRAAVHGVTKSRTHWATELNWLHYSLLIDSSLFLLGLCQIFLATSKSSSPVYLFVTPF